MLWIYTPPLQQQQKNNEPYMNSELRKLQYNTQKNELYRKSRYKAL